MYLTFTQITHNFNLQVLLFEMTLLLWAHTSRITFAKGNALLLITTSSRVLWTITFRINDFEPTAEKPFVLGLPTGSSPIPTYKALIKLVKDGKLS